jgi:hypothetical protein
MDSLRLCFIDIYATSDDFDYLYGKDLSELEEIINKEFSASKDGENARTVIRVHEVLASSSTAEIMFKVIDEEIDFINDTEIVDFINDELVMNLKVGLTITTFKQACSNENICVLENDLQFIDN